MLEYKNNAGDVQCKEVAIKCSPEICSYIMNRNGGYIFVGLCGFKVYDRCFVSQCFHRYEYKSKPTNCGKNVGQHKTDNCRSTLFKCVNGLKVKISKSIGENPLPIRSNGLQLENELSKYFLLKVKGQKASLFPIFQFCLS